MAVEPWNSVILPLPGAASSCRIPFTAETARAVEAVLRGFEDVLQLLDNPVLVTEIRVLYEVLYVYNNGLRNHKPFRSIKQVEQCINRLNEMKLQGALQDLRDLCPNKMQRDDGVDAGHCEVPSQPMLEWLCLKLLGASRLLVRTLAQCTKAFTLTRRHLRLAEFIVLNLVLVSMLSRLWVFFRGVLRALVPVYQRTVELHHLVAQCRPMAYLTNFTLPEDLESFLSHSHSNLLKKESAVEPFGAERAREHSVLDRLFEDGVQPETGEGEEQKMMQMLAREGVMKSSVDLGKAISREGPHIASSSSGLDIKSMLQQTHGVTKQCVAAVSPNSSDPALVQQKRTFLRLLRMASSFSEMAVQLKEMMDWCRRCELRQERRHLALVLLQCQRMRGLDGEGISVRRKRRRLCVTVQHVMFKETGAPPLRSSPAFLWRTGSCLRSRFTSLMVRFGSVRNRLGAAGTRVAKDRSRTTARPEKTRRNNRNEQFLNETVLGSDILQNQKETATATQTAAQKPNSVKNSEIDDIFASIGF